MGQEYVIRVMDDDVEILDDEVGLRLAGCCCDDLRQRRGRQGRHQLANVINSRGWHDSKRDATNSGSTRMELGHIRGGLHKLRTTFNRHSASSDATGPASLSSSRHTPSLQVSESRTCPLTAVSLV